MGSLSLVAASVMLAAGCGGGGQYAVRDSRGIAAAPVGTAPAFHVSPIFLEDPRRHGSHVLGDGQGTVYRKAPRARSALLQGLHNSVNRCADSLALAQRMGSGVVSRSFGAGELFACTERHEVFLRGAGMTVVGAAGDWGSQGLWPATSPGVLAVGGMRLEGMVDGERRETVWPRSGGGYSLYSSVATVQAARPSAPLVTGRQASVRNAKPRSARDVAIDADPFTGQFVVYRQPGRQPVRLRMGGTSIGTPQVAGTLAIASAHRLRVGDHHVGRPHDGHHAEVGPGVGATSRPLRDVSQGSSGACPVYTAAVGYDLPAVWGTPLAQVLPPVLVGL